MYKIGEFSEMTDISKRMLRYYDEKGLMKAKRNEKGYRYYEKEDLILIDKIKTLSRFKFPLKMIKGMIDHSSNEFEQAFKQKISELEAGIIDYEDLIGDLNDILGIDHHIENVYDVSHTEFKSRKVLFMDTVKVFDTIDPLLGKLNALAKDLDLDLIDMPFVVYNENDDKMMVAWTVQTDIDHTNIKILDKALYLTTLHFGPYDKLDHAIEAIEEYAFRHQENIGYEIKELFITDHSLTSRPEHFATQIGILVE